MDLVAGAQEGFLLGQEAGDFAHHLAGDRLQVELGGAAARSRESRAEQTPLASRESQKRLRGRGGT
jgi:hypothetical protein